MIIGSEAVEAAARVMQSWDLREGRGEYPLDQYEEEARELLEAAAPHMLDSQTKEGTHER